VLGVLAPPEALEPDLAGSCVPLADELDEPGVEAAPEGEDELDEAAPGLLGLPALPPTEAEPDAEPGELGGVEEALLLLPLVPAEPAERWLSSPQAARPSAMATATARVESFMKPPWLGYWKLAARTEPARSPLELGPYARRTNAAPTAR
jgi:hypothetical protein